MLIAALAGLGLFGCAGEPQKIPGATPNVIGEAGVMEESASAKVVGEVVEQAEAPAELLQLMMLMEQISGNALYADNKVQLLIDGPATYAAMLSAIREARRYIYFETYLFSDDATGREFATALRERARAGIDVRLIHDAFGSRESADDFFDALRNDAVKVLAYHDVEIGEPVDLDTLNVRDHRKILVVDGQVAFTGGINISRKYAHASRGRKPADPVEGGWRDTHIRISGPAADGFAALFESTWRNQDPSSNLPSARSVAEAAGSDLVAIMSAEGAETAWSPIRRTYLEAMRQARSSIWLTQAYFAPDKQFLDTLRAAASRGVDVRITVPAISDVNVVVHASRFKYGGLLEAGIRIFEITDAVLHAKTAVIDGVWSTVGSSNMDYRSFLHNDEVNAVIFGKEFGSIMQAQYVEDQQRAREVTIEAWKRRSWTQRVKERLAWALEYWI